MCFHSVCRALFFYLSLGLKSNNLNNTYKVCEIMPQFAEVCRFQLILLMAEKWLVVLAIRVYLLMMIFVLVIYY